MIKKLVMIMGGTAVGKTMFSRHLIRCFMQSENKVAAVKIDCLSTEDDRAYKSLGIPVAVGLSKDICPDHFLVSNIEELIEWGNDKETDILLIETAGLCNRCSPATKKTISVCIVDSTNGYNAPRKFGPMLNSADIIVLTKTDVISQAEKEIIVHHLTKLNSSAAVFSVEGLSGYGIDAVAKHILTLKDVELFTPDVLRHTMPSAVCSYCIGECRVGKAFQQGVVGKIEFGGEENE